MEELKAIARDKGLWNLFLPHSDLGAGFSNLEYAPLAEQMGRVNWCSEVFNCSAPDTGNMEVLDRFGTEAQKAAWLTDLLDGKIRSAFAMTEPQVASSDATNMEATGTLEGDEWVLNGRKWYISGAGNRNCKLLIFMCLTNPEKPRHQQHSQFLVPADAEGIEYIRPMQVFGYDDAPVGHMEIQFDNVRVPGDSVILGAGRGFEIAQGRLGPGRIHHCMRSVGQAERAIEAMCERGLSRQAFGMSIVDLNGNQHLIAQSRIENNMARLLTLMAADKMDKLGNKAARSEIAQIKVIVPQVACDIVDRAIQMHGAMGVSQDTWLSKAYGTNRIRRLADGPDEVHLSTVAKSELYPYRKASADK
jgi:acyl-CoA dehydrogenase